MSIVTKTHQTDSEKVTEYSIRYRSKSSAAVNPKAPWFYYGGWKSKHYAKRAMDRDISPSYWEAGIVKREVEYRTTEWIEVPE